MSTVLIIGASRGIGLELARQYAQAGWTVHATTRSAGGDLAGLAGVHVHHLEVTEPAQAQALASSIGPACIDVLIHNAGVSDKALARETVMRINAEAPIAVTTALLGCLTPGARVALMSSQLGARRGRTGSLGVYGDSKAALNDRFREVEPRWRAAGLTAIVLHPGWVRTDMGGPSAPVGVEESASGIRAVIAGLGTADNGRFLTWEGKTHPW